jgi:hypothetical protein
MYLDFSLMHMWKMLHKISGHGFVSRAGIKKVSTLHSTFARLRHRSTHASLHSTLHSTLPDFATALWTAACTAPCGAGG